MKRSEMVKKLMETMGTHDSWEKQCSYMLQICEDEGMTPPWYTCVHPDVPEPTPFGSCKLHKWEPE